MKRHYVFPENVHATDRGMPTYCVFYDASDVDIELEYARVLMRELWRLEGEPSEDLARRCKAFMGGG